MKTTADIAWEGGQASAGESVDAASIPEAVKERWLRAGVLIEDGEDLQ